MQMNINYKYDVFISWTGKNRKEKNIIKKALKAKGIDKIYDSDIDCKGNFIEDFTDALMSSKVYIVILSEHLLNDPNVNGGYFSEVKRELYTACDLERKGILNIVVFSCSDYFSFHVLPDRNDLGRHYYACLNGQSQTVSYEPRLHEDNAVIVAGHAQMFIEARDAGNPKPPAVIQIPLKKEFILFESKSFFGRTDEIEEIDKAFEEGIRVVVLSGIGGIGKTEIAKKYVNEHLGQYFCPQQITLSDEDKKESGLRNLTSRARFEEEYDIKVCHLDEKEQEESKIRWLGELDERIILIIDNYNNIEEHNINVILKRLRCKVILTTRVTGISLDKDKVKVIEIKKLPLEAAWEMFCKNIQQETCDTIVKEFEELHRTINGHTLTLYIIAKMMKQHGLTLKYIIDKLKNPEAFKEKVYISHNEEAKENYEATKTFIGHLKTLFDLSRLFTDNNHDINKIKLIVQSLALINLDGIKESSFKKACNLETANELIYLSRLGWIERIEQSYTEDRDFYLSMHPLCSMLIITDLKPSPKDVSGLIEYILNWANIDNETDYSKIREMKHRIGFMKDGFAHNNHEDNRINIRYAEILCRLGEVKEALLVLHKNEKEIHSPVDKVIILEKITEISFNCGIDRHKTFEYGLEIVDKLNQRKELRIAQFALKLSTYAIQTHKKGDALKLLSRAYEIAEFHREPYLLTVITAQLTVLGKGKSYINKTKIILRQADKQPGSKGVVFYSRAVMVFIQLFLNNSNNSGNFMNDLIQVIKDTNNAFDSINIMDIKKIRIYVYVFFLYLKSKLLIRKYEGKISKNDYFEIFYIFMSGINSSENDVIEYLNRNITEQYIGLSSYLHEIGLHTIDFNDYIKTFNKILLLTDNDNAKKYILNNYNQLANNSNFSIDYNNLNSWQLVAEDLMIAGYIDEAICAYGNIYMQWQNMFPHEHFKKAEILYYLSKAFKMKHEYRLALDYCQRSIDMFSKTIPNSKMHLSACSVFVDIVLYGEFPVLFFIHNRNLDKKAFEYIEMVLQRETIDKLAYLSACYKKASLFHTFGMKEKAKQYLKNILDDVNIKDYPVRSRKRLYNILIFSYNLIGDYQNSLIYSKKYYSYLASNKTHSDIMNLAERYSDTNNYKRALSLYNKSLEVAFKGGNKKDLELIQSNICIVLSRLKTDEWFKTIRDFSYHHYRKIKRETEIKYFYKKAKKNLVLIISNNKNKQKALYMLSKKLINGLQFEALNSYSECMEHLSLAAYNLLNSIINRDSI